MVLVRSLLLLMVLGLVVPGAVQARGLSVTLPSTITAERLFSVRWEGETGPRDPLVFGGFVVNVLLQGGNSACPTQPQKGALVNPKAIALGGQNIANATPFRGANQLSVTKPGRYRLCGYVSKHTSSTQYELLTQRAGVRVRARPRRLPRTLRPPAAASGIYVASAPQTAGGAPNASVRIEIAQRKVVAASASALTLSTCSDSATPSNPLLNTTIDVASTGPATGFGARIDSAKLFASLPAALPEGTISIHGGFATRREIHGVITGTSPSGVCQGTFAFTAKRQ